MMIKRLIIILALFFCHSAIAKSEGEWIEVAHKLVSFKAETDEVKPSYSESHVTKIKLHVDQGTVHIKNIKVVMSDGQEKEYDVLGVLNKGMETRVLTLPKGEKVKLKKVLLSYDSMGNILISKKVKVTVLGYKPEAKKD